MAVDLASSAFDPSLMGDAIEALSSGNAVGYGYAINYAGNDNAAVGSGGLARTAADVDQDHPIRNFSSLVETEVSSVSKTITASAILHILQSLPGGLDAALKTKLVDYLPSDWMPGANVGVITLRHLLTHASGFAEINNAIGVDFNNYGNNTYANLESLIEAGLPAPNVMSDNVYDAPRWNLTAANGYPEGNYNNANFTLLARVVLPKLIYPALNLTAAVYPGARDAISGALYTAYVQDEIFEPLGVFGADMVGNDANPVKGYDLATANVASGMSLANHSALGGAFGWKLSARELATFLDGIQHNNSILSSATRQMRNDQQLGWYNEEDAFGDYYGHNGATTNGNKAFRSKIEAMPGGVEVAYLMNSDDDTLPGGSIGDTLRTAYVNGWTDLTVAGTSGADDFQASVVTDNGHDAIRVTLNGDVQFTRWLDGLDSITLNGGLGNDTFTINGWRSSVELNINGSSGNDAASVLPSARNIEAVNGMNFSGGTGDDSLTVNDASNPYSNLALSRNYAVGASAVTRYAAHPAFPGNPGMFIPVAVGYSGVENLTVTTGGQTDLVAVTGMTSGDMEVRTGNGDDVITVAAVAGNLEAVDGLVVNGQAGIDAIRLYDNNKTSADPDATPYYDVDANSVARYVASLGGIAQNPGPAAVQVDYLGVENLELTTTDLADVIRVHATTTGGTSIHGGAGGDVLNASPNGNNFELVGDLTFDGDAGLDSILLNDQSNPYSHPALSRLYNVSAAGVSRYAAMPGNPMAIPILIDVAYSSVENMTLRTGGQTDVVNIESVPSASGVIETGAGNDAIVVSPTAMNLENVNGLTVVGGVGADALTLHDENNPYELGPGGSIYTATPGSIGRFAEHVLFDGLAVPVGMEFSTVETITLAAGNQADEFRIHGEGDESSLTIQGNGGADRFRVAGPAFDSLVVHGDAPIFAPGDQMTVNEDGMYPVGAIPGLYPTGSGGVTIGDMTIQYTGLEQADLQPQIYGGPGDFDENGLVNAEDLAHPTLGWKVRFGDDLDGQDFLVWQRNLGANRLPATDERSTDVASGSIELASDALNAASRLVPQSFQPEEARPASVLPNSQAAAPAAFLPPEPGATRRPWRPTARDVAILSLVRQRQDAPEEDDSGIEATWDQAFAAWQSSKLAEF
jgi:hypothetical protein